MASKKTMLAAPRKVSWGSHGAMLLLTDHISMQEACQAAVLMMIESCWIGLLGRKAYTCLSITCLSVCACRMSMETKLTSSTRIMVKVMAAIHINIVALGVQDSSTPPRPLRVVGHVVDHRIDNDVYAKAFAGLDHLSKFILCS
jgi:hypothetical protein